MPGRPWTSKDVEDLRRLCGQGHTVQEAARRLDRSVGAVRFKSQELRIFWKRRPGGPIYQRVRELEEALAFYADPDTYCAIGIFPDPPCGEFINDMSEVHPDYGYNRPMPGARARRALGHDNESHTE